MLRKITLPVLLFFVLIAKAQMNPAITHWLVNTNSQTGFAGIATNVQEVQYSANYVYISTTDIADWIPIGYDWPNNPWFAENQNFVFKITLNPTKKTNNQIATGYGHIGVWLNGVSIYNPKDAKSYLDSSTWFQNAFFFEHLDNETMDSCLGHPNQMHEYHLHVHPKCLWDETDSSHHAPLLGYAFDGFPIYGCYGYADSNGTGGIRKLNSGYRLRNITDRTVLPNGTILGANNYGPSLATYPLGAYMEDYEYIQGLGDLDAHNGRFCVTPEYPEGIYAYFVTLDSTLNPAFPYVLGTTYYGTVQIGNTGPNSGHNVISESVTVYTSVIDIENKLLFLVYPNPANQSLHIYLIPSYNNNISVDLYDIAGHKVKEMLQIQTSVNYAIDLSDLSNGAYFLTVSTGDERVTKKIMIAH